MTLSCCIIIRLLFLRKVRFELEKYSDLTLLSCVADKHFELFKLLLSELRSEINFVRFEFGELYLIVRRS